MFISFFIFNYKEDFTMNTEQKGTKLTLQIGETTLSWESPYEDHDMHDLIDAFQGLCIGHTWLPITFVQAVGEWYEDTKSIYPELNKNDNEEQL